jgi:hypothetical protein
MKIFLLIFVIFAVLAAVCGFPQRRNTAEAQRQANARRRAEEMRRFRREQFRKPIDNTRVVTPRAPNVRPPFRRRL